MGAFFSRIFSKLFGSGDIRVLILGLENAGKTTFLYQLQFKQAIDTVPSNLQLAIGFNIESVQFQNIKLQMWDLGGQKSQRQHWRSYYPNTQGLIYVIDSSDQARFDLASQELIQLYHEEDLKNVPVLVLANKQDVSGALSEYEIEKRLMAQGLQKNIKVFGISAKMNLKIENALAWLVDNIH